jgi:uncharacterized protein
MHAVARKENIEVSSFENRQAILSAIILGVSLLIGLAAGGYFVGKGGMRFKSETRTVTVKGLVEKEVKSDQAVWVLHFRRASDDLKGAHEQISADREAAFAFLQKQGFKDEEIVRQPTRTPTSSPVSTRNPRPRSDFATW